LKTRKPRRAAAAARVSGFSPQPLFVLSLSKHCLFFRLGPEKEQTALRHAQGERVRVIP